MKYLLYGLVSFFVFTSFAVNHESEEAGICNTTNTTFNGNEQLRYDVYYNWNFVWVRAGYVNFSASETTYAGKPSYHFKATGRTLSSYDNVYKVRDYYQSYVDKSTMKPLKYVRDIDEGGYTKYEELRFDYGANKIASKVGKTKDKLESKTYSLDGCTFDVVSIMYHLRTMDLDGYNVGDKIPIKVFFNEDKYDLYVKYLGTDTVKVKKQGKFKCHKVSPLLIEGDIFTETDKMVIWVTADENKLPVMIESPIKVGSIKAVIGNAENLKYPVDAKL